MVPKGRQFNHDSGKTVKAVSYTHLDVYKRQIISFILVSLSPVNPVQQYVGSVPNVSVEQRAKIARCV